MPRCYVRLLAAAFLTIAGLAPIAHADDTLSAPQKQAVDQMIHDYLLAHPEVVVESLKAAQAKSDAVAMATARREIVEKRDALLHDPNSPVGGNPQGDATIVEFFDYRCPYCKEVEPSLEALLAEDKKLRIVYKEFPILGPVSVYASHVAFAARKQGKYDAFHRAMMNTKGNIDNDTVLRVAASVGLDMNKVKADMDAPDIDAAIKANMQLADTLAIDGTPAFIIGNNLTPGATDIDTLRQEVADLRKGG